MKRISIPYFPAGLKYSTPFLLAFGVYLLIMGYPIWIALFTLLAMVILTTNYVTEISLDKREFRDFVSVLWIPFRVESVKFNQITKIVITKVKYSQKLTSRARTTKIDWSSFTATLLTDDNKALELLTSIDKKELIEILKEFTDFLKVDVEDHTTSEHFMINLKNE